MKRQIIFLEVTANKTAIKLPYKFSGTQVKATIVNWEFAPIDYLTNGNGDITSPYYFQLRFEGSLSGNFIPFGACQDMIQLPLLKLGGWPTYMNIPVPLPTGFRFDSNFQLEVYGEGTHPEPWAFGADTRLLLWIEVETEPEASSQYNSMTYLS